MKSIILAALALVYAPSTSAGPIPELANLSARAPNHYHCNYPKLAAATNFQPGYVGDQVKAAVSGGFDAGKSGYPHIFENKEEITWSVDACDSGNNPLYEYPIYRDNKMAWQKGTPKKQQEKTAYRVVYANANGATVLCGVMSHEDLTEDGGGSGPFHICPGVN